MTPTVDFVALPTHVTLQYAEQGAASGVPVLFLHGIGDAWRSFERVLQHLPESLHAFALTQRGHGDSSRPEDAYRYTDFTADVAAFMDALQLEAAVVVGHSMGSAIAQRFAIDSPQRTLGLVLVGSFFSLQRSQAAHALQKEVSTLEDPVDPGFVRDFQQSVSARPVPESFFEDAIMCETMKLPARVWREVLRGNLQDDFSAALAQIDAPTLLVWGDQDAFVPRSEQDAQTAAIPGSRLVVYEGTGHAIPWEAPERLASDLAAFVESEVA